MTGTLTERSGCIWRIVLTITVMTIGSLIMLLVALATGFRLRRFYTESIAAPLGGLILRLWRIRMVVHDFPGEGEQRIYISNHTSTLDVFVLIALRLPDARFFLSGWLRKILPLGLIGDLTGIIWTVPQQFPERRVAIFVRAEQLLRRTGESVYLSPEGMRITTGEIGHFNKGAFHLATNMHVPIVPFFIRTPKHVDPGMGFCPRPGQVDVYFKPAFDTSQWQLEDLQANKERVRDQFVRWHREYHD